jgi:hypothetical protein
MNHRNQPAAVQLDDLLRRMPREAMPKRDLWPGIDHAINAAAAPSAYRALALAASVLLVIGSSLYFGLRQPRLPATNPAVDAYISELQTAHQLSKQAVLVEFRDQQAWYPDWEEQLHELEQAEQIIYGALRNDPDNRELLSILRDVQDKQLKLINAVFKPHLNAI